MKLIRIIPIVILLLGSLVSCNSQSRPNILLITLDTTRADHLGCYGYEKKLTPQIDLLAKEGIKFDFAIAQAALTPISHASILTGLYPFEHGLRVLHGATCYRLEEGENPTLPVILKNKGWKTAAFVSAFPVSEYFGLHYGFDTFNTGLTGDLDQKMQATDRGNINWDFEKDQRKAIDTTDQALAWLKKNEDPFFMWLHFFDPHDSKMTPPPKFYRRYLGQDKSRRALMRNMYDAEIAYMDIQLGRLIKQLKDSGQYDNTLIVITNDHGEGLGDHNWDGHRIIYQEQIRMPLIIRYPGCPEDKTVPNLVRSIDIMPTILEYAGVEIPPISGKSLMGLIRGETEKPRFAYADALIKLDDNKPNHAVGIYNDLLYCAMNKEWKLIYRQLKPEASELYNLEKDPKELENVIDKHPKEKEQLLKILQTPGIMIKKLIKRAPESDATKRLNELGYK